MALIIHLGIAVLFAVLGVIFLKEKGAFLIAGYNTMSQDEKSKINEKKLCKFMGKFMLVLAACWLVIALSEGFQIRVLFWGGLVLFSVTIIVGIVYANTGNRFSE